jgi:DNA (cytosine-5)-methyltransferase 1
MEAGWRGLFAIEKDRFAFDTLSENLIRDCQARTFEWPKWLPVKPHNVASILRTYLAELRGLAGQVDLLVGGPPCQGFSSAGRRESDDPRNMLLREYVRLVRILRPKLLLIENVRGFTIDFKSDGIRSHTINYAELLIRKLEEDYWVFSRMIDTSRFGVPQQRHRFFIIAIDRASSPFQPNNPFEFLEKERLSFLRSKALTLPVTSRSALSDLEVQRNGTLPSNDSEGFVQTAYTRPLTTYQKLMHRGLTTAPSDLRLARHRPDIAARFKRIIQQCHAEGRLNVSLSAHLRDRFSLRKKALRVLDPDRPAPTITSMPDDLLHYAEPRTLTVRENARLQSFPDWFTFKGKYTTGGDLRRKEVPRFTQVANAVPPIVAEAIGRALITIGRNDELLRR